jgi:hypothetical protein
MFHDIPTPLSSSFRDPAGFVFRDGDVIKRAVTHQGGPDHQLFLSSGLRTRLAAQNLIVEFLTEAVPESSWAQLHTILVPRQIPYVSYPYEWSFDQLKDAALLTLRVEEESLACGMSLKDASAFNIQFVGSMPVFIDLSSFEPDDGGPWLAYEQFCRHSLGQPIPQVRPGRVGGGFRLSPATLADLGQPRHAGQHPFARTISAAGTRFTRQRVCGEDSGIEKKSGRLPPHRYRTAQSSPNSWRMD